jgi:uncharacterized protein (DUF169 family)
MLGLRAAPVAVAFLDEAPAGIDAWSGAVPAGCAFWKEAQQGKSFYTVPSDHYNCAVGAHTHAIELPAERGSQLMDTVGFMVESGYLEMSEVPGIPRLPQTPGVVAYAPVEANAFTPDAVLIAANAAQAMLIYEAALRAGAGSALTQTLGRPTCAILPLTLASDSASMSLACAGNRMYTGLEEGEFYVSIPGGKWPAFEQAVADITVANEKMRAFYAAHRAEVSGQAPS